ncbi:hypothetical protein CG709_09960 [Lachnotalea glycerini]|nr:hypothetical protein CG709_09960 [Lachnotalea glycerini]
MCDAVTIPVIAIGGINIDNVQKLKGSGIQGIAVVSAIFASKNITKATKDLLNKVKEILNEEVKEY